MAAPRPAENPNCIVFHIFGVPRPYYYPPLNGTDDGNSKEYARQWASQVEAAARVVREVRRPPELGAGGLALYLRFSFETADVTKYGIPHTARPDADNLSKLVQDALMRAGLLSSDDCFVADLRVQKVWGRSGGVEIIIDYAVQTHAQDQHGLKLPFALPAWLEHQADLIDLFGGLRLTSRGQ